MLCLLRSIHISKPLGFVFTIVTIDKNMLSKKIIVNKVYLNLFFTTFFVYNGRDILFNSGIYYTFNLIACWFLQSCEIIASLQIWRTPYLLNTCVTIQLKNKSFINNSLLNSFQTISQTLVLFLQYNVLIILVIVFLWIFSWYLVIGKL